MKPLARGRHWHFLESLYPELRLRPRLSPGTPARGAGLPGVCARGPGPWPWTRSASLPSRDTSGAAGAGRRPGGRPYLRTLEARGQREPGPASDRGASPLHPPQRGSEQRTKPPPPPQVRLPRRSRSPDSLTAPPPLPRVGFPALLRGLRPSHEDAFLHSSVPAAARRAGGPLRGAPGLGVRLGREEEAVDKAGAGAHLARLIRT